jgi:NAD(P)-dependent dehydrogenase (short-subunit alcohol dehydrogenase family)
MRSAIFQLETKMKKIVVVTGGGSGIGRAIANKLAAQLDFRVYNVDRCHEESQSKSPNIFNIKLDVSDIAALKALFATISTDGHLYGVVANAGIHQAENAASESLAFQQIIDFNVCRTYDFILEAVPYLKGSIHQRKHVVLTSSASSLKGLPSNPGYAASKAALDSIVRSLAVKFAPDQIYFNSVNPGWVETRMIDESLDKYSKATGKTPEELITLFAQQGITGKFAKAEEVADLVWLLMSPSQASIVGQNIVIDNGYMLK